MRGGSDAKQGREMHIADEYRVLRLLVPYIPMKIRYYAKYFVRYTSTQPMGNLHLHVRQKAIEGNRGVKDLCSHWPNTHRLLALELVAAAP